MSNEIKNLRSALVQVPRNKAAYGIMIWEILIVSVIGSIIISINFFAGSDSATVKLFFALVFFLTASLVIKDIQIILIVGLAICWAYPFMYLWGLFGGFLFLFLSIIAFFTSLFVHYYALIHLGDLTRND